MLNKEEKEWIKKLLELYPYVYVKNVKLFKEVGIVRFVNCCTLFATYDTLLGKQLQFEGIERSSGVERKWYKLEDLLNDN